MSCFKKVSLSIAALGVSALGFAGSDLDSRVKELEKQMKEVRTETATKNFGAKTASARPAVEGAGFFFTFDVLYWQSKVAGTEFAYTNDQTDPLYLPVSGRIKEIEFNKWDWGFRAGAGYNFEHGDWDLYANYTYFSNDSDMKKSDGITENRFKTDIVAGSNNVGYNSAIAAPFVLETAYSQYKFNFNRVDLELGRDFFVAKFLSLRPHMGLMGGFFKLKQLSRFSGGEFGFNTVTVEEETKFTGIGPRGGFNTKWFICNGISLVGNMAGAFVYGNFKNYADQYYSIDPNQNDFYLTSNFHRFSPMGQMFLGFAYDKYLNECQQHFSVSLGWDIQYWWRLSQKINPTGTVSSNDVSMQGVTLDIRIDF